MSTNVNQVFLAITFQDDTTALMGFVTQERMSDGTVRWNRLATQENIEATIAKHLDSETWAPEKLPIKRWRFVSEEERAMFEHRDYRNALVETEGGIVHDMVKARELHRDKLRTARAPILAAKDVAYIRADEVADAVAKDAIADEKQALRDVTDDPAIEAAQTIEDLRTVWPLGLQG